MKSKILHVSIAISVCMSSVYTPNANSQPIVNKGFANILKATHAPYTPVLMRGLGLDPGHPMTFDFFMDTGDSGLTHDDPVFKSEAQQLIHYFLAVLTIPEEDLWVNLSPNPNESTMAEGVKQTRIGQSLLAQDFVLKQLTASLLHPDTETGARFWQRVYAQAFERYGTTEMPVDTFHKVWIVPDRARLYQHQNRIFTVENHLKVMLEQDYLAASPERFAMSKTSKGKQPIANSLSTQVMREILIPEIEREVNEGAHFAPLRQIYSAMILATWYKRHLKKSLLNQLYADQQKASASPNAKAKVEHIYQQYLASVKSGVFDFVQEERDTLSGVNEETHSSMITRRYFSGGAQGYHGRSLTTSRNNPEEADAVTGLEIRVRSDMRAVRVGDKGMAATLQDQEPLNPVDEPAMQVMVFDDQDAVRKPHDDYAITALPHTQPEFNDFIAMYRHETARARRYIAMINAMVSEKHLGEYVLNQADNITAKEELFLRRIARKLQQIRDQLQEYRFDDVADFQHQVNMNPSLSNELHGMMSVMRMLFSDQLGREDKRPPIEYAIAEGLYLNVAENVFITPVTQSFRRHYIFTTKADGTLRDYVHALIPGRFPGVRRLIGSQPDKRRVLGKRRMAFANKVVTQAGESYVLKPIARYELSTDGRDWYDFSPVKKSLKNAEVIYFEGGHPAKRLRDMGRIFLNQVAEELGWSVEQLDREVVSQVKTLLDVYGQLGYHGQGDMHSGNILFEVYEDRIHLRLVGDFEGYRQYTASKIKRFIAPTSKTMARLLSAPFKVYDRFLYRSDFISMATELDYYVKIDRNIIKEILNVPDGIFSDQTIKSSESQFVNTVNKQLTQVGTADEVERSLIDFFKLDEEFLHRQVVDINKQRVPITQPKNKGLDDFTFWRVGDYFIINSYYLGMLSSIGLDRKSVVWFKPRHVDGVRYGGASYYDWAGDRLLVLATMVAYRDLIKEHELTHIDFGAAEGLLGAMALKLGAKKTVLIEQDDDDVDLLRQNVYQSAKSEMLIQPISTLSSGQFDESYGKVFFTLNMGDYGLGNTMLYDGLKSIKSIRLGIVAGGLVDGVVDIKDNSSTQVQEEIDAVVENADFDRYQIGRVESSKYPGVKAYAYVVDFGMKTGFAYHGLGVPSKLNVNHNKSMFVNRLLSKLTNNNKRKLPAKVLGLAGSVLTWMNVQAQPNQDFFIHHSPELKGLISDDFLRKQLLDPPEDNVDMIEQLLLEFDNPSVGRGFNQIYVNKLINERGRFIGFQLGAALPLTKIESYPEGMTTSSEVVDFYLDHVSVRPFFKNTYRINQQGRVEHLIDNMEPMHWYGNRIFEFQGDDASDASRILFLPRIHKNEFNMRQINHAVHLLPDDEIAVDKIEKIVDGDFAIDGYRRDSEMILALISLAKKREVSLNGFAIESPGPDYFNVQSVRKRYRLIRQKLDVAHHPQRLKHAAEALFLTSIYGLAAREIGILPKNTPFFHIDHPESYDETFHVMGMINKHLTEFKVDSVLNAVVTSEGSYFDFPILEDFFATLARNYYYNPSKEDLDEVLRQIPNIPLFHDFFFEHLGLYKQLQELSMIRDQFMAEKMVEILHGLPQGGTIVAQVGVWHGPGIIKYLKDTYGLKPKIWRHDEFVDAVNQGRWLQKDQRQEAFFDLDVALKDIRDSRYFRMIDPETQEGVAFWSDHAGQMHIVNVYFENNTISAYQHYTFSATGKFLTSLSKKMNRAHFIVTHHHKYPDNNDPIRMQKIQGKYGIIKGMGVIAREMNHDDRIRYDSEIAEIEAVFSTRSDYHADLYPHALIRLDKFEKDMSRYLYNWERAFERDDQRSRAHEAHKIVAAIDRIRSQFKNATDHVFEENGLQEPLKGVVQVEAEYGINGRVAAALIGLRQQHPELKPLLMHHGKTARLDQNRIGELLLLGAGKGSHVAVTIEGGTGIERRAFFNAFKGVLNDYAMESQANGGVGGADDADVKLAAVPSLSIPHDVLDTLISSRNLIQELYEHGGVFKNRPDVQKEVEGWLFRWQAVSPRLVTAVRHFLKDNYAGSNPSIADLIGDLSEGAFGDNRRIRSVLALLVLDGFLDRKVFDKIILHHYRYLSNRVVISVRNILTKINTGSSVSMAVGVIGDNVEELLDKLHSPVRNDSVKALIDRWRGVAYLHQEVFQYLSEWLDRHSDDPSIEHLINDFRYRQMHFQKFATFPILYLLYVEGYIDQIQMIAYALDVQGATRKDVGIYFSKYVENLREDDRFKITNLRELPMPPLINPHVDKVASLYDRWGKVYNQGSRAVNGLKLWVDALPEPKDPRIARLIMDLKHGRFNHKGMPIIVKFLRLEDLISDEDVDDMFEFIGKENRKKYMRQLKRELKIGWPDYGMQTQTELSNIKPATTGGIDLNSGHLEILVDKSVHLKNKDCVLGKNELKNADIYFNKGCFEVALNFDELQAIQHDIEVVEPVIIDIKPITNVSLLLGLSANDSNEDQNTQNNGEDWFVYLNPFVVWWWENSVV